MQYADPWEAAREERRGKVEKNSLARARNMEVAGLVPKGTRRKMSSRFEEQKKTREGQSAIPHGVPVDMHGKKRGRDATRKALQASRISTASMGKFDKARDGEEAGGGKRKKTLEEVKNKKKELRENSKATSYRERGMKIAREVISGKTIENERKKRGDMRGGETGHDYDFDDGLGGGGYKKKKGRAAAGKMKKVTKKNIK